LKVLFNNVGILERKMEFLTGIQTAFGIKSYLTTLKDYLDPSITKVRKRIRGDYYAYDITDSGTVLFWRDALGSEFLNPTDKEIEKPQKLIQPGDIVELKDSNISRWIPLFPGKRYSKEGNIVNQKHKDIFPKEHEFGLEEELVSRNDSFVLSGNATVRLLPFNNQYLLCSSSFECDTGIPVLVSEKLYEKKLQRMISREGSASAKIIGTLSELPGEWKDRIEQSTLKNIDTSIYGLPRLVIKVDEIKKVGTASPVVAKAWTQFLNTNSSLTAMISSLFLLQDSEDIQKAVNMVANYNQFLESPLIGGKWTVDVEFDEVINWFGSKRFRKYESKGYIPHGPNGNKRTPAMGADFFALYYSNPLGRPFPKKDKTK
jgi:hypothetical protein